MLKWGDWKWQAENVSVLHTLLLTATWLQISWQACRAFVLVYVGHEGFMWISGGFGFAEMIENESAFSENWWQEYHLVLKSGSQIKELEFLRLFLECESDFLQDI